MHQKSDVETGLFLVGHRYYNPEWGRWLSPDDIEYLDPQSINGLNLYAYCKNDLINYVDYDGHRAIRVGTSNRIRNTSFALLLSKFNFFGYETRNSAGWSNSPDIATSFFGRIGVSSYITHAQGRSGLLYAFAGSTTDVMNWFGTTFYAGVGINLFDILGVEAYLETVGIGAQVSIGNFSIGANINLIGGTSITFGWDTDLENGMTKTDGFIVGVNTGCLVAVIYWVYKFVTIGDPSPVPGLQPAQ